MRFQSIFPQIVIKPFTHHFPCFLIVLALLYSVIQTLKLHALLHSVKQGTTVLQT